MAWQWWRIPYAPHIVQIGAPLTAFFSTSGSYLHDLCDHGIQAFYRGGHGLRIKILSRTLFGYFNTQNRRVVFSICRKSLPMGVKCRIYYLVFATNDEVNF
jgi:hypothetical protein